MRKFAISVLPALALFAASPALALTPGQADCPVELASKELSQALVSAMVDQKEGDPVDDEVIAGMSKVFQACIERENVPEAQRDDYMAYATSAVAVAEQSRQLKAAGINPATIDKAFGIGPNGRNSGPDDWVAADFDRLRTMLAKDGIKIESLPERTLGLIGSYAAIAADLWELRARLK